MILSLCQSIASAQCTAAAHEANRMRELARRQMEMSSLEGKAMVSHLQRLIDDIGLETLFYELELDPAEILAEAIRRGQAELPPGLAMEEYDDPESEA